jgi:hypothetical protein
MSGEHPNIGGGPRPEGGLPPPLPPRYDHDAAVVVDYDLPALEHRVEQLEAELRPLRGYARRRVQVYRTPTFLIAGHAGDATVPLPVGLAASSSPVLTPAPPASWLAGNASVLDAWLVPVRWDAAGSPARFVSLDVAWANAPGHAPTFSITGSIPADVTIQYVLKVLYEEDQV